MTGRENPDAYRCTVRLAGLNKERLEEAVRLINGHAGLAIADNKSVLDMAILKGLDAILCEQWALRNAEEGRDDRQEELENLEEYE